MLWLGVNSFRILELLVAAAKVGAISVSGQLAAELRTNSASCSTTWNRRSWSGSRAPTRSPGPPAPGALQRRWICHNGPARTPTRRGSPGAARHRPRPARSPRTLPLLLLYTAAFDGQPTRPALQRALISHSLVLGALRQVEEGFVCLDSGPLFHVGTVMFAMTTLVFGGTNVVLPTFDPELACALIEQERCQGAVLFPAMVAQLAEANADRRYDLSSLRFSPADEAWNSMITIDSSPWGRSLAGYGQTQVAGMLTFHGLGLGGIGSSGRPSPLAQVRIVDPEDRDVPDGEVGEIVARGPHVFSGYFNRPELTAATLRGGWHHTGDLGRRENGRHAQLRRPQAPDDQVGRREHLPRRGGASADHASACRSSGGHRSAGRDLGAERRCRRRAVRGRDGHPTELIEHVRAAIASYKKPKSVIFVDGDSAPRLHPRLRPARRPPTAAAATPGPDPGRRAESCMSRYANFGYAVLAAQRRPGARRRRR